MTSFDLSGVARGDPPKTLSWTWTWSEIASTQGLDLELKLQCNVDKEGGSASVYLSSLQVNIAVESTEVHRVQFQGNANEKGGKYTEAEPRCICPSFEFALQRSLWGGSPECNSN